MSESLASGQEQLSSIAESDKKLLPPSLDESVGSKVVKGDGISITGRAPPAAINSTPFVRMPSSVKREKKS